MSFEYGFYNAINHDRRYTAEQVSRIFDGIITDGVYATIGNAYAVTVNSGMQLNIGTGRAWFNHTWSYNDATALVTVPPAHAVFGRIDAVVLEVNLQNRENQLVVVQGTAASDPQRPTLAHGEEDIYQYPLAYVAVGAAVTEIASDKITPTVGTSQCPFVTGVLQGLDVDELIATWKHQFDTLFNELEEQIAQAASQTLIDGSVTFAKLAEGAVNRIYLEVEVDNDSANWIADNTTEWASDYPYRYDIPLIGVTESYIPECFFAYQQQADGEIYGTPRSYNGGVSIWASARPTSPFVIPQIEVRRVSA